MQLRRDMLVVQRRVGQRIVVGDGIEIVVAEVGRAGVRLAIHAPRGVPVIRGEVFDAVAAANAEAATLEQRKEPNDAS